MNEEIWMALYISRVLRVEMNAMCVECKSTEVKEQAVPWRQCDRRLSLLRNYHAVLVGVLYVMYNDISAYMSRFLAP